MIYLSVLQIDNTPYGNNTMVIISAFQSVLLVKENSDFDTMYPFEFRGSSHLLPLLYHRCALVPLGQDTLTLSDMTADSRFNPHLSY